MTRGRASGCECRLCYGHIAAADACDRLLDLIAVASADGRKICRVLLLVDGREEAGRRCSKDAAREGEEGQKDGAFAGKHVGGCFGVERGRQTSLVVVVIAKAFAEAKERLEWDKKMNENAKERLMVRKCRTTGLPQSGRFKE